jgi:hypothetical protein
LQRTGTSIGYRIAIVDTTKANGMFHGIFEKAVLFNPKGRAS